MPCGAIFPHRRDVDPSIRHTPRHPPSGACTERIRSGYGEKTAPPPTHRGWVVVITAEALAPSAVGRARAQRAPARQPARKASPRKPSRAGLGASPPLGRQPARASPPAGASPHPHHRPRHRHRPRPKAHKQANDHPHHRPRPRHRPRPKAPEPKPQPANFFFITGEFPPNPLFSFKKRAKKKWAK